MYTSGRTPSLRLTGSAVSWASSPSAPTARVMTRRCDGPRQQFPGERRWGIEDCRHLSARLERDLLSGGESVVRVPPKLMAQTRASARTRGKSDPIDALAVARAVLREPDLPVAAHDQLSRAEAAAGGPAGGPGRGPG